MYDREDKKDIFSISTLYAILDTYESDILQDINNIIFIRDRKDTTMAGRPKRDVEVKGYLLRLTPELINRLDLCCSLMDVATRQRLPRNSRMQQVLEEWCAKVEAEHQAQTPTPTPTLATVPPVPQEMLNLNIPSEPTQRRRETQEEEKKTASASASVPNETLERILAAREQYDKLSLREFSQLLFDREIYRSLDRKTREQKPLHSGTLARWLRQAGMS